MPKSKPATRRKPRVSQPAGLKKKIAEPRTLVRARPLEELTYSDEYRDYLERYEAAGVGRPRLSAKEFDRLDDELLDLLALQYETGLDDEQTIRLQELEYLLLDSEQ